MFRIRRILLASLLVSAPSPMFVGVAGADGEADRVSAGKSLLAKGDDLADKGNTTEAVIRYKEAFEKLLPGLRNLKFSSEVKRDVTPREKLGELLLKEFEEDQTQEEFRANELGMKALGFLPSEFKLKETLVKLYSEEIAAFYDPKTKTMHLIKEPGTKGMESGKKPGFLEKLMGKKGGFDKDENKTVIAHELTHALADQNFDIRAIQEAVENDDDHSMAVSSLIEGEATLAMLGAQMEDWAGQAIVRMPSADLDRLFGMLGPLMMMGGGQSLRNAPPILSESMIFPYLRGVVFCAALANEGGWEAIDRAYRNPPLSTEQILHPEKYERAHDVPMALDLGKLNPGSPWKELGRNVVGEMQLAVLLKSYNGKQAAAGWDGDSYAVFESPEGKLGVVWLSTWDTDQDAVEFEKSYLQFQTKKLGGGAKAPEALPDSVRRPSSGRMFAVERRGKDVVVVEGFSTESSEPLLEAAFKAQKTEKTAGKPKK